MAEKVKETVSLRQALSTKKLLKKRITKLVKEMADCVCIIDPSIKYVQGLPVDKWNESVKSKVESYNRLIERYNAYNEAIIRLNAEKLIDVPRLNLTSKKEDSEIESLSYAGCISRKKFYLELKEQLSDLQKVVKKMSVYYETKNKEVEDKIESILKSEFNSLELEVSNKDKLKRAEDLRNFYKLTYCDPAKLTTELPEYIEKIDDYLNTIDSILGTATETTMVTVEY